LPERLGWTGRPGRDQRERGVGRRFHFASSLPDARSAGNRTSVETEANGRASANGQAAILNTADDAPGMSTEAPSVAVW
jgi:hypothetical protein